MAERVDNARPGPDITEVDARKDAEIPWRIFAFIGALLAVLAVVYVPSNEAAGIVMLSVAAILGGFCAVFLWRNLRQFEAGTTGQAPDGHDLYLPDASPWPFGIGLGVTLVLNGLLIGAWFLVPGIMVLVVALAGFARQSRHRR